MVNQRTFRRITYLIGITMALVLVTQVYRSNQNYQVNKQRFINEVQNALDLSVEAYYADRAREDVFVVSINDDDSTSMASSSGFSFVTNSTHLDSSFQVTTSATIDTLRNQRAYGFQYFWTDSSTAGLNTTDVDSFINLNRSNRPHLRIDSTFSFTSRDTTFSFPRNRQAISQFAHKIMISIAEDQLNLDRLSDQMTEELKRKNLPIGFEFRYRTRNGVLPIDKEPIYSLNTTSKSTYLPANESLTLYFENASLVILRNGIGDLLVSFFIVVTVMAVLLYLYRVIVNQKQLALIKDDLISNITHEFKTPIATISSAIEGIANFNETNDKEKTRRYLGISNDQLKKLNLMVEKILETATIDSGEVEINPEETDLVDLTERVIKSHQMLAGDRVLNAEITPTTLWLAVDPFHLENVLSNLIDNAIKYGGDEITVRLQETGGRPVWQIIDNGGHIEKAHRERIFEKLYRIPKGNRHDVKGFGIGLYYTRAIVEKHGGKITLDVKPNHTCFTVSL